MKMSRIETAARVVLKFNEAFNRHDVPEMMALMGDDCIIEDSYPAPEGTLVEGKEAITQFWLTFFQESPQAYLEIEDVFGFGFRCVACWRYDWVDKVGKPGHVRGVDIFHVKNGLISEKLSYVKG